MRARLAGFAGEGAGERHEAFDRDFLRARGRFETAIEADTGIDWIAAEDIGAFAATAFADPERFHGHEIDLAAECFTLPEVAAKMAKATGKPVSAVTLMVPTRNESGFSLRNAEASLNLEGRPI